MTAAAEAQPPIQPAKNALVALAREMRPRWDADAFEAAVLAAGHAGWTWEATCRAAFRVLLDPNAEPRDLRDAARRPTRKPKQGGGPSAEYAAAKASTLQRLAEAGPAWHQRENDTPAA